MDSEKDNLKHALSKSMHEMGPYLNLGMQMIIPILLFTYLGYWLDNKYDASPLWILIFSMFGLVVAFYQFFKTVRSKK